LRDSDFVFITSLGVDNLGLDGNDFGIEFTSLLSGGGLLERFGSESVLSVTRDVVFSSNVLT
jgi:hypothetical protein